MGLISGMLGIASEIDQEKLHKEFDPILTEGEIITSAFKLVRDLFVFTDKRLILVDKQGITGKKIEYNSIPYKSISRFAVETTGHFDLDAELKIWISGHDDSVVKEFKKDKNVVKIQQILANYVLN